MTFNQLDNRIESQLIAIFGDRGSGKSLLLSWFLLKSKLPFFCNFHVFKDEKTELSYDKRMPHPRYHELHPEELLEKKDIDDINHINNFYRKRIGITEAYEYFECRLGMGSFQRYMSYVGFQSRKRHADLIIDTQLDDTIDNRFLRLCNYIIIAEPEEYGFHYYGTDRKVIFEFDIPTQDAEKFWNKYDSWEVVTTPQIENLRKEIEVEMNKPKLKENIKILENLFWSEYKGIEQKKITHGLIENFLLDHDDDFPNSGVYEGFLYARLQKPKP